MRRRTVMIGTAGWSIPRELADHFPSERVHLERYSKRMSCVEINSSFYRAHSFVTYKKWASLTPTGFRFSVKLPGAITHEQRLRRARTSLREFLTQVSGLGQKLGPLLVQLPPSLEFNARVVRAFFAVLREEHEGLVACEPRHASWFEPRAEAVLSRYQIGRVATDPTSIEVARTPGGWSASHAGDRTSLAYYRLHGSPRKYWSRYPQDRIHGWADEIASLSRHKQVWCIFDNTASGAALANAVEMQGALQARAQSRLISRVK
ncbi:MAG: DUF72 domain-containing protein [Povalibacter sp.]